MTEKKESHSKYVLRLVILSVAINGLLLIGTTLLDEVILRHHARTSQTLLYVHLISGLTLLYLSFLLVRRKTTALLLCIPVYAFILGVGITELTRYSSGHHFPVLTLLRSILFPLIVVGGLAYYRNDFKVKSDLESFGQSVKFIVIILAVAFLYGTGGFMLMDKHDFHQEIGFNSAAINTIDQFGLISGHSVRAYSRRAKLFTTSLSVISIGALAYGFVSLVQPLKARFVNQTTNRQHMRRLLSQNSKDSEDFFKLWPQDKAYIFNKDRTAGLSLRVHRGIALCAGDPAGPMNLLDGLIEDFQQLCYGNDWLPAFVHTTPQYTEFYKKHGFTSQKIGEEAILSIEHFNKNVKDTKYFRHINNKFTRLGYTTQLHMPPHSQHFVSQIRSVSSNWLTQPGRVERGFMMGYFSNQYIQQCPIMTVSDESGAIKAFLNQVYSFEKEEANYDLLRSTSDSPGNINDFLLLNFIDYATKAGFKRINMGLCPLVGLDKHEADHAIIDGALRFAYANGDRIYSFSGLHRFKAKYEPSWSSRYVIYVRGIRGFSRTMNALIRAMRVPKRFLLIG
ncbi:MAG TPA: phosphatidylglycerol lysyltransferase domain-containing protein [Patescibacteria group bacterium]|jgi:phosphatidylglycerol lysyltransferase|nr:phosphatidylglycerol lysyltransferase domain-containing protein [Patescibacteria group bacterium]